VKRYRVELAADALAHVESIQAWWLQNRPRAPRMFLDELAAALEVLETLPRMGRLYTAHHVDEMRRIALLRTRYHLYYTVEEQPLLVRVHAVWHMSRGGRPPVH
jgi:plasmid stabilization system protein ParE